MMEYGTTVEQLARVIMTSRAHAHGAQNALRRSEVTMDEYLGSPFTVEPLREIDDVVWANGGCAVIVTSAERAHDSPNGGAYIVATAQSSGYPVQHSFEFWPARMDMHASLFQLSSALWSHGVKCGDIETLQCYDTTPISVVLALEGLGFCAQGDGGGFISSGGIDSGGALEVCTNGGHTSAAYIHGFSQVVEAVRRVRKPPAGGSADRFALVSGAPTAPTSAAILASEAL
jgi:acetyl-CoA acetyltransferase